MKIGVMFLVALASSAFPFQNGKIESWHINFSMGPGYPNPDGGLWAANMIYDSHWFEFRWAQNGEIYGEPDIPAEYINDIGLLYGKGLRSKHLLVSALAGLSYTSHIEKGNLVSASGSSEKVYTEVDKSGLGIPIDFKAYFHWKYFGVGTTIFSNLNMPKSYAVVSFGLIVGRL